MKVVEIFDSIDGEGIRTGQPVTFIRLAGCNLRCSYCDTLYALFGEEEKCVYTEMTVDEIISKVNPHFKRITLTGGEPLLHRDSAKLVQKLSNSGYEVNIETNGAVSIADFIKQTGTRNNIFFTIDYKLPSSDMCEKMLWENFEKLLPCDVVKFVVGSGEDVNMMKAVMDKLTSFYKLMPNIFIGAVFGKFDGEKLVDIIMNEPVLKDARYQIQLHKYIWDPEKRGV